MTELSVFSFESKQVRTINKNGEPWFVAKDVAECLGVGFTGHTLDRISDGWKGSVKFTTPGGLQDLVIISEPAVYKLAFRSNKEEAERFTDWVASEVLPSIRKTGSYSKVSEPDEDISELMAIRRVIDTTIETRKRMKETELKVAAIEERVKNMDGDTGYATVVAYCRMKGLDAPLTFAQDMGKECSKLCKTRDIRVGKVRDERFFYVNSYPIAVLDEAYAKKTVELILKKVDNN